MLTTIEIKAAGNAAGTSCPLWHVLGAGEVVGTITNVHGLFRVYVHASPLGRPAKESWFPSFAFAREAVSAQLGTAKFVP